MAARDKSRFTTTQAAWIALVVFGGWLVFLFLPVSQKPKPEASPALPPMAAQSKLEAVGLANNPDWQGLPDYFAIWAEGLDWQDDRVGFAYWNPGSRSYSYFFEATRVGGGYRFRILSRKESAPLEDVVAGLVPEGKESDAHPFVFWRNEAGVYSQAAGKPGVKIVAPPPPPIKVDLPVKSLPVPPPPPPKEENH